MEQEQTPKHQSDFSSLMKDRANWLLEREKELLNKHQTLEVRQREVAQQAAAKALAEAAEKDRQQAASSAVERNTRTIQLKKLITQLGAAEKLRKILSATWQDIGHLETVYGAYKFEGFFYNPFSALLGKFECELANDDRAIAEPIGMGLHATLRKTNQLQDKEQLEHRSEITRHRFLGPKSLCDFHYFHVSSQTQEVGADTLLKLTIVQPNKVKGSKSGISDPILFVTSPLFSTGEYVENVFNEQGQFNVSKPNYRKLPEFRDALPDVFPIFSQLRGDLVTYTMGPVVTDEYRRLGLRISHPQIEEFFNETLALECLLRERYGARPSDFSWDQPNPIGFLNRTKSPISVEKYVRYGGHCKREYSSGPRLDYGD